LKYANHFEISTSEATEITHAAVVVEWVKTVVNEMFASTCTVEPWMTCAALSRDGWTIMADTNNRAVGFYCYGPSSDRPGIMRASNRARMAQRAQVAFKHVDAASFFLCETPTSGEEWQTFRATDDNLDAIVAISHGAMSTLVSVEQHTIESMFGCISGALVYGRLVGRGSLGEEDTHIFLVFNQGVFALGCDCIFSDKGDFMISEKLDQDVTIESLGLNIDLGVVQLELGALVSLRKGVVLNLNRQLPLECVLRLEGGEFARGELFQGEIGLGVRIRKVVGDGHESTGR